MVHIADWEFFADWVAANQARLANQVVTSQLYRTFSRMVDGKTYVSYEFFTFITEVRAYYINALLAKHSRTTTGRNLTASEMHRIDQVFSSQALDHIRSEGGEFILDAYGITAHNIFSFRNVVVEAMRQDM